MATPPQKSRAESLPGNERGVPGDRCHSLQPVSGRNTFCESDSQFKAQSCNFLQSSSESTKHPPSL